MKGARVGRLTIGDLCALEDAPPEMPASYRRTKFVLRHAVCDCGAAIVRPETFFRNAMISSCGCLRRDIYKRTNALQRERARLARVQARVMRLSNDSSKIAQLSELISRIESLL